MLSARARILFKRIGSSFPFNEEFTPVYMEEGDIFLDVLTPYPERISSEEIKLNYKTKCQTQPRAGDGDCQHNP